MPRTPSVITVTLNPAIDQTMTVRDFTPGAVNRVERVQSTPGGKGVNVAAVLAAYGISVAATGFLGGDNAATFEEMLERKGIGDHFVRIAGQTRVGLKITDPVRGQTTDINLPGIAPQPGDLTALHRRFVELTTSPGAWIVLAGSLPPGVNPGFYRDMIERFRGRGHRVVLDTSGEPLRLGLDAAPHIVKPNIQELEALIGAKLATLESVIDAARLWIARGTTLVAVSMGAEGALFVTAGEAVHTRPPVITVRSTVGAGDAMVAGLITGYLRKLPLSECARLATAFSIHALTQEDSNANSIEYIEALAKQMSLESYR